MVACDGFGVDGLVNLYEDLDLKFECELCFSVQPSHNKKTIKINIYDNVDKTFLVCPGCVPKDYRRINNKPRLNLDSVLHKLQTYDDWIEENKGKTVVNL